MVGKWFGEFVNFNGSGNIQMGGYATLPKCVDNQLVRTPDEGGDALVQGGEQAVHDGNDDEREQGAADQPPDDDSAEFGGDDSAFGEAEREGHEGEDRSQRRHEDGAEATITGFEQGVMNVHLAFAQVGLHAINQHNGVGDDDADEHQHADHG